MKNHVFKFAKSIQMSLQLEMFYYLLFYYPLLSFKNETCFLYVVFDYYKGVTLCVKVLKSDSEWIRDVLQDVDKNGHKRNSFYV